MYTVMLYFQAQTTEFVVPDKETDFFIKAYIGSAFVLKFIELVQLIYTQCTVDIFFIDWERELQTPGAKLRQLPARTEADSYIQSRDESVSVWRRLLVTNEWAEIQVGNLVMGYC
jgi:meckelin